MKLRNDFGNHQVFWRKMKNPFRKDPQPEVNPPAYPAQRRVFRSEELFQSDREIVILHGDSQYRLQITKAGKLILNK